MFLLKLTTLTKLNVDYVVLSEVGFEGFDLFFVGFEESLNLIFKRKIKSLRWEVYNKVCQISSPKWNYSF